MTTTAGAVTRQHGHWFDKDGEALSYRDYARLQRTPDYRCIANVSQGEHSVIVEWLGTVEHPYRVRVFGPSPSTAYVKTQAEALRTMHAIIKDI